MQRRKALKMTQEELAEQVGLSKNHLSNIERGVYLPTTQLVLRLCAVLGETPDFYLIGKITTETDEISSLIKRLPENSQKVVCRLIETYLGQHRTIWQEHSAKDFASYESYKRAGILYVFPPFIAARMGQKIGRRPQTQLCGAALDTCKE